jgi:hypothetical protein
MPVLQRVVKRLGIKVPAVCLGERLVMCSAAGVVDHGGQRKMIETRLGHNGAHT